MHRIASPIAFAAASLVASWALAAPKVATDSSRAEPDPILSAMESELSRTIGHLRMGELPAPYYISYTMRQGRALVLRGVFGALTEKEDYPYGQIKVQTRTGTPDFDNSHFAGRDSWNYNPFTGNTTFELQGDPPRFDLWSLTDQAYKSSLERLSAKRAYRQSKLIVEDIPDFAPATATQRVLPLKSWAWGDTETAAWSERVRRLSAVFKEFPKIQTSNVAFSWGRETSYFADSEGGRFRVPTPGSDIYLTGATQAKDGMELDETRTFVAPEPEDLPSEEDLFRQTREVGRDLSDLVDASTGTLYVGPVVFEGQAAGEFFNQLLAHNVSFPQPVWTENEDDRRFFETGAFADRTGVRVTAASLSAFDDPTIERFEGKRLAGHYVIDDQGVPPERVKVVEKGILRGILMSRSPVKGYARSNGHGRGGFYEFPSGRIGNLFIEPLQPVPFSELKGRLIKLCREQELEYGLIIRRMTNEDRREMDHLLSPPTMVYKVYVKDGREEPVRGLVFSEVTLRALRDIVAASKERFVYNYYQLGPVVRNRGGVPASIIAPSVLVQEMELRPTEKKPSKLPYLPHPYFAGKKR